MCRLIVGRTTKASRIKCTIQLLTVSSNTTTSHNDRRLSELSLRLIKMCPEIFCIVFSLLVLDGAEGYRVVDSEIIKLPDNIGPWIQIGNGYEMTRLKLLEDRSDVRGGQYQNQIYKYGGNDERAQNAQEISKSDSVHESGASSVDSKKLSGQILGHHMREDKHRVVTIVKKVTAPYPVEKTKYYPVIKKVMYPVKVPVPQPYPVEKEVPYPVKVYVKVPVKIPKPVPVVKEVRYPVPVPVDRPVPFKVYIPQPYPVEKKVHYKVEVPVPEPFPIAKKIPVPVKVKEIVAQPYPVEKEVRYPVEVKVDKPIPVHVAKPYPVRIEKPVPYPVDKPVPYPVKVPVYRPVPIHAVDKPEDYSQREQVSYDTQSQDDRQDHDYH